MALDHERWCKYCHITWDVQRDPETDAVLNNSETHCPECDSDDAMKLADAQSQVRDEDPPSRMERF